MPVKYQDLLQKPRRRFFITGDAGFTGTVFVQSNYGTPPSGPVVVSSMLSTAANVLPCPTDQHSNSYRNLHPDPDPDSAHGAEPAVRVRQQRQ